MKKYLITLGLDSDIHDELDTMSEVDAVITATDQEPQVLLVSISPRKARRLARIDPRAQIKLAPAGKYVNYETDTIIKVQNKKEC